MGAKVTPEQDYAIRLLQADLTSGERFSALFAEGLRLLSLSDQQASSLLGVPQPSIRRWASDPTKSPAVVFRDVARDVFLERMLPDILEPGCWVQTGWGPAVCIEVRGEWAFYRYKADVPETEEVLWVANGDHLSAVKFIRGPDEKSRRVLTLTGPYGRGAE